MKLLAAALLLLPLAAIACSGDDGSTTTSRDTTLVSLAPLRKQPEPVQTLGATLVAATDGVLEINVQDVAYSPNHLKMAVGDSVTVRVSNKDAQQHNLRLAGYDGQYDTEDDAVTEPQAIAGGASGELTFAPPVAGAYTFRCDFHPGSMGGQIVVQ